MNSAKFRMGSLLLILAMLLSLLPVSALAAGAPEPPALYVSAGGTDEAAGTKEAPLATLAEAVKKAEDGSVISVMTDLTTTECARFYNKNLTITSANPKQPVTITRGENFKTISDTARSWYNPAMIEVQGSTTTCGLTLTHVILDDAGEHMGTVFAQAISGGTTDGNLKYVQDAMIASNATKPCTITLGDGAVLRNFGGMSAVRVTDQAQVIMKSGSVIEDTTVTDRVKSSKNEVGPAGAIWSQGSQVTMETGSKIQNSVGRAIYMDGGKADVNGSILNIKADKDMWQGTSGTAIHLRNKASGILSGTASGFFEGTMVSLDGCKFELTETGKMMDSNKTGGISMADVDQLGYNTVIVNGEIGNLKGDSNPIQGNSAEITIGKTANLHDNEVGYGTLYMQADVDVQVYGKINNNYNSKYGAAIATPGHGHVKIHMYDGAELCGNIARQGGGALQLKDCTFIMDGGNITGNYTKEGSGGAAYLRENTVFIMNGGEISNNYAAGFGGGIAYYAQGTSNLPVLQLHGGKISGNMMNTVFTEQKDGSLQAKSTQTNDVAVSKDEAGKVTRYVSISDTMQISDPNIYMEKHGFNLSNPGKNIKFGNASAASETALTTASSNKGWSKTLLASLWYQNPQTVTNLSVNTLTESIAPNLPVYALVLPTGADGNPASPANPTVYAVKQNGNTYPMKLSSNQEQGNAVALVQPTQDFGTLTISGPAVIQEKQGAENYETDYTITYTMSENLKSILEKQGGTAEYTLTLSPDQKFTGSPDTTKFDGKSMNVTCTLPADAFQAGQELLTSAVLTITVGNNTYTVPSNIAQTTLTKPAPVVIRHTIRASAAEGGAITPSGSIRVVRGHSKTFVLTADEGFRLADVVVDGQSVGAVSSYTFERVRADHEITAVFEPLPPTPDDTGVSELLNTDHHFAYLRGFPDGRFGPEQNMTRAEMAQMFYNLLRDQNVPQTVTFEDVDGEAWYAEAVQTLASLGILQGTGHGNYHPERPMTRAEFTAVAMRFATPAEPGDMIFSDVFPEDWFYEAVMGSLQYDWLSGYPDGTFRPGESITRAEVTTVTNRMLGRAADRPYVDTHTENLKPFQDLTLEHWAYYDIAEAVNTHEYHKDNGQEFWT